MTSERRKSAREPTRQEGVGHVDATLDARLGVLTEIKPYKVPVARVDLSQGKQPTETTEYEEVSTQDKIGRTEDSANSDPVPGHPNSRDRPPKNKEGDP